MQVSHKYTCSQVIGDDCTVAGLLVIGRGVLTAAALGAGYRRCQLVMVVWCGVVWCGVVWCGVVWCGVVWCAWDAWTGVQHLVTQGMWTIAGSRTRVLSGPSSNAAPGWGRIPGAPHTPDVLGAQPAGAHSE